MWGGRLACVWRVGWEAWTREVSGREGSRGLVVGMVGMVGWLVGCVGGWVCLVGLVCWLVGELAAWSGGNGLMRWFASWLLGVGEMDCCVGG